MIISVCAADDRGRTEGCKRAAKNPAHRGRGEGAKDPPASGPTFGGGILFIV